MLAMHMADTLLTPRVAVLFILISAAGLVIAARRARAGFEGDEGSMVPLMGVLGAFVFAAQMVNFPILPGTSGHLCGAVLLAILLGPDAASLVIASIIIVQCLIYQDGGLLALGTNILNIGLVPCYLGAGLVRLIAGRSPQARRLYLAIFVATVAALATGAALVAVEVALSGMLAVPFARFLLVMVGLHLLVGVVEAFITFGIVAYLARVRPELLRSTPIALTSASAGLSTRAVAGSLLITALLLGGLGSLAASRWPDALESLTASHDNHASLVRPNEDAVVRHAGEVHTRVAPLPEYQPRSGGGRAWTSVSGILGTIVTLAIVWVVGRGLRRQRRPDAEPAR